MKQLLSSRWSGRTGLQAGGLQIALIALAGVFLITIAATSYAARVATLTYFSGKVEVQRAYKTEWELAKIKMPLYINDKLRTGPKSSAEILLDDNSILRLKEKSVMEIKDLSEEKGTRNTSIGVLIGKVWTNITPQPANSRFQIFSASATVGVRGTILAVSVDAGQNMRVLVFEGSVKITTIRARLEEVESAVVFANQAINISPGRLFEPEPIKPEEIKEWNEFNKEIEKMKKELPRAEKPSGVIRYSIRAKNVEGKEKESGKYSIPVSGTAEKTK